MLSFILLIDVMGNNHAILPLPPHLLCLIGNAIAQIEMGYLAVIWVCDAVCMVSNMSDL